MAFLQERPNEGLEGLEAIDWIGIMEGMPSLVSLAWLCSRSCNLAGRLNLLAWLFFCRLLRRLKISSKRLAS